jgi:hypothetical protein
MSSISDFFLQFATGALQLATMVKLNFFRKDKARAKKYWNNGLVLYSESNNLKGIWIL